MSATNYQAQANGGLAGGAGRAAQRHADRLTSWAKEIAALEAEQAADLAGKGLAWWEPRELTEDEAAIEQARYYEAMAWGRRVIQSDALDHRATP